ncbi:MAG TPA: glycosyltransferase [Pseudolysinimonas sp.]|nr:glycosyltransferase [Pseudolysinimonas sp.]
MADFAIFYRARRHGHELSQAWVDRSAVTVVLTAYNDEESIGNAVRDFLEHPLVKRVIVVDNNSIDGTSRAAVGAGAVVVTEVRPGYGYCVYRALTEGAKYTDTSLVALCEGDMTFRAADLEKLLAYIPHGDVVNGTRIVEQLREKFTQLTTFMFWGNFVGGKLLEFKHLGRGTVTDLGTTYKLCRSSFLRDHLSDYDPRVNLEFNAHFLDTTMKNGFKLVEAPVTFYAREGESKGGNVSNRRATKVGLRMLIGLLFSWRFIRTKEVS